jgi:hypothetical protein
VDHVIAPLDLDHARVVTELPVNYALDGEALPDLRAHNRA